MRRVAVLAFVISLFAGSCLPAPATNSPAPGTDLEGTAAVFVQQTLEALPSITPLPSNTPVLAAETATSTPTVTRTVSVGTVTTTPISTSGTAAVVTSSGTLGTPVTSTSTAITSTSTQSTVVATETLHTRFYGTLPPKVAYNNLELVNKSKAEAYISLQVTVAGGSTTILEYPVGSLFSVEAPVGQYKYVAWVGGNKIIGSFTLSSSNGLRITIYKDRIEVKKR